MKSSERNIDLDIIKGTAIISVVLYHFGLMNNGYLGVDIFFVVNGYFITNGIYSKFQNDSFNYKYFLKTRLFRLFPLICIATIAVLLLGYFLMLPDDYDNLNQSVVASNFFANNILSCITTKNYWDVVNTYKPLMHLWYVGVLMQCYIIFPIIIWICIKLKGGKFFGQSLIILAILSLLLFVGPWFSTAHKFYYLPFRLYEFLLGSIVSYYSTKIVKSTARKATVYLILYPILAFIAFILLLDIIKLTNETLVISIAVLTALLIFISVQLGGRNQKNRLLLILALIGSMSYSIYIWHQIIIAYYRYSVNSIMGTIDFIIVFTLTIILSIFSYYVLEKPLSKSKKINKVLLGVCICVIITSAYSLWIYSRGGVVRDIPELNVYTSNIHKGMHKDYTDRVYKLNNEFPKETSKKKVLVIGNSFARDWVNILLESKYSNDIVISYVYPNTDSLNTDNFRNKCQQADLIFWHGREDYNKLPPDLKSSLKNQNNFFGIGIKSFGESNGNVYSRRSSPNFYLSRADIIPNFKLEYEKEKVFFGDRYFDLIMPLVDEDGKMPVFTDNHKFISQDCRHLTQEGAKYYSQILDLSILGK